MSSELERATQQFLAAGWRAVHLSDTRSILMAASPYTPTNHLIHLLVSVITVGVWIPIWIIISLTNRRPPAQRLTLWAQAGVVHFEHAIGKKVQARGTR